MERGMMDIHPVFLSFFSFFLCFGGAREREKREKVVERVLSGDLTAPRLALAWAGVVDEVGAESRNRRVAPFFAVVVPEREGGQAIGDDLPFVATPNTRAKRFGECPESRGKIPNCKPRNVRIPRANSPPSLG